MKRSTQGFTLTEALVGLLILGILMTTVISSVIGTSNVNNTTELKSQATIAAQRIIDGLRTIDPASLPRTGTDLPKTVTVSGHTFNVVLSYCNPDTYCKDPATGLINSARQIKADVIFNNTNVFSVETVFTSVGSGATSAGVNP